MLLCHLLFQFNLSPLKLMLTLLAESHWSINIVLLDRFLYIIVFQWLGKTLRFILSVIHAFWPHWGLHHKILKRLYLRLECSKTPPLCQWISFTPTFTLVLIFLLYLPGRSEIFLCIRVFFLNDYPVRTDLKTLTLRRDARCVDTSAFE